MKHSIRIVCSFVIFPVILQAFELRQGLGTGSRDICLRMISERLSNSEKVQLIQESVSALSAEQKLKFYSSVLRCDAAPSAGLDPIVLDGLEILKTIVYVKPKPNGWPSEAESFVDVTFRWAMSGLKISNETAVLYFETLLNMPALTETMISDAITACGFWSSQDREYPYLESFFSRLVHHPLFDQEHAKDLIQNLTFRKFHLSSKSSTETTYVIPAKEKFHVMQELQKTGLLDEKLSQLTSVFLKKFALESIAESQEMNLVLAEELIERGGILSAELIFNWMRASNLTSEQRLTVVSKLVNRSMADPSEYFTLASPGEAHLTPLVEILDEPFRQTELTEDAQKVLWGFVLDHIKENDNYWPLFNFAYSLVTAREEMAGTQWAFEKIVQHGATNEDTIDYILRTLSECETKKLKVCGSIRSKEEIYRKIVGNNKLSEKVREKANKLLLGSSTPS